MEGVRTISANDLPPSRVISEELVVRIGKYLLTRPMEEVEEIVFSLRNLPIFTPSSSTEEESNAAS